MAQSSSWSFSRSTAACFVSVSHSTCGYVAGIWLLLFMLVAPAYVEAQCSNALPSWVQSKITIPELRSSVTFDAQRAIADAGSAQAALALFQQQIRFYENYLTQLRSSAPTPSVERAIIVTEQGLIVNRAAADVLRCWTSQPASSGAEPGKWSHQAIDGLQGLMSQLQERRDQLRQSTPTIPDELTSEALPGLYERQREADRAARTLDREEVDRQIRDVTALLAAASSGNTATRDLDTLFTDLADGGAVRGEPTTPIEEKKPETRTDGCKITISGTPGALPLDLGNDPISKVWSFLIPIRIDSECSSKPDLVLKVRYTDGGKSREILQRPYWGLGFDAGSAKVDLPATAVARITMVATESITCRCAGKDVEAIEARQIIYGEADVAEANRKRDEEDRRRMEEENARENARCASVKTLSQDERKQLCSDKAAVWQNVHLAWHRTTVQLLAVDDLLSSLEAMESDLVGAFNTDSAMARRRVDIKNAIAKIDAMLSIVSPIEMGVGLGKAATQCVQPLNLSEGLSAKDVKNHIEDIQWIMDTIKDPSLSSYLEEFSGCVLGKWSPTLGRAREILELFDKEPTYDDEEYDEGMNTYRREVLEQTGKLRKSANRARAQADAFRVKMDRLYKLMDEVTLCACD